MEKETRNAIQSATQKARRALEEDFQEQLEGLYDIHVDGSIAPKAGPHLSARERRQRDRIVAAIEHKRAGGMKATEAVLDYLRDAAFTTLNRFVALKMLEARGIVQECISKGDASSGFAEFSGLAPGIKFPDGSGYRLYLECVFDELSTEVKVLFDRRDPSAVLWPKRATFDELLDILNAPELAGVWSEDETIGWVYQFFNGQDERRKMREESQAPRNSRELAVRNQFFTPRYVVQFLSDNTLGRIWYEMRDGDTRLKDFCEYMVRRPNETWAPRAKKDPRDMRVLDPACGSGHFLLYCFDLLLVMYEEAWADEASPVSEVTGKALREDYPEIADLRAALPGLILRHNLHGVDIDPRCAQIGQLALWMRAQRAFKDFGIGRAERPIIRRANIVIAEPMPGEKDLLNEFLAELKDDKLEGLIRRALDVPADKRVRATKAMADSLAELVETVWDGMKLAGEMGTLLKIERDLARAIDKGRAEWEDTLPLFRVADYGLGGITNEKLVRVVPGAQEDFWTKAEKLVFQALADYAAAASGSGNARRRLFAEDAAQGFALADLLAERFDVALMNPPFGDPTVDGADYLDHNYADTRLDLFAAFCKRLLEVAAPRARIGAITPRDGMFKKTLGGWRELVLSRHMPLLADLGIGVLDATVRVAAYVIENSNRSGNTEFIDLVDLPSRDSRLLESVQTGTRSFSLDTASFRALPLSRFLYWMPKRLWQVYADSPPLENLACTPRYGLATFDDERFCRLAFEVAPTSIGREAGWVFMSKGGDDYPYGGVSNCLVRWKDEAAEMAEINRQSNGQIAQTRRAISYYFKPAITFSNRSVQFGVRWHPANYAFSMRGAAIIPIASPQSYLLGYFNSRLIRALIQMQTASQTYTTGVLKELRWVEPDNDTLSRVSTLATKAFDSVRLRLTTEETDPFYLGLLHRGDKPPPASYREYATWRHASIADLDRELRDIQEKIDRAISHLYGVETSDIERCERADDSSEAQQQFPPAFSFAQPGAVALASYLVGLSFGRWKHKLQYQPLALTSAAPPAPPAVDLACAPVEILSDEIGGAHDITDKIRTSFDLAFPEDGDAGWLQFEEELGGSLRVWVSNALFASHVQNYSAFGRAAPIYWQLATPSASYSVWLYIHAFTKDTLFRVQNDYVAGKLAHEERQLETLRAEGGPDPVTAQRKAIEAQEAFVDELRTFLDEVKRVAPLWNPNLDDGVIINFAPLWRLVPQHKPWQKELKSTWDSLCVGKYDWAHLAMHLWPERVVLKCAEDRSLAIAHDLEEVFWYQDDDEKWKPREKPTRPIDALVKERTSSAVKAALKSLMEAPEQSGGARRGRGRR